MVTGIIDGVKAFVGMVGSAVVLDVVDCGSGSERVPLPGQIRQNPGNLSSTMEGVGNDLADMGILKALPMSLSVSLRACNFMFGATAGM